jgi:hypothetical protein
MMNLIAAAVLAAQAPAAPAPAAPQAEHAPMQMGQMAEHTDMDCCKKCCEDMAKMHEGHTEHGKQPAQ